VWWWPYVDERTRLLPRSLTNWHLSRGNSVHFAAASFIVCTQLCIAAIYDVFYLGRMASGVSKDGDESAEEFERTIGVYERDDPTFSSITETALHQCDLPKVRVVFLCALCAMGEESGGLTTLPNLLLTKRRSVETRARRRRSHMAQRFELGCIV
jgi:hypothetical protein